MNNYEYEAQKLADFVTANTKIGASPPTPSIPGDDQQFEDIVRAVEILVGDRNKRFTYARGEMAAASEVMQAVEDNISVQYEAWAIDQILQDEVSDLSKMSVFEIMIREALPDLLQDWMNKNMEAIATDMITRDALHDAMAQVWSKKMKNST